MVEGEDQEDEEGMSLLVNRFCTKNKQWGFGLINGYKEEVVEECVIILLKGFLCWDFVFDPTQ
jgi:hypothetical protein